MVKKQFKKSRKNNIRGGATLSPILEDIELEEEAERINKLEIQRKNLKSLPPRKSVLQENIENLLPLPPSTRLTASQSLRPLPLSVSPLSLVSSSASGSAERYIRTGILQTLPKPPLTEEAEEAKEAERFRNVIKGMDDRIEDAKKYLERTRLSRQAKEEIRRGKQGAEEYKRNSRINTKQHYNLISGVSDTRDPNDANQATRFLMETRSRY